MVKLVSLDTSSSCSGWSIYVDGNYYNSGAFDFKKEKNGDVRLKKMCTTLLSFLENKNPDIVCVETTVVSRNAKSQRMLTMILGVVYGWCIMHNCDYEELRPTEWRKLVKRTPKEKIGRKREELKKWSIERVKDLYNIDVNDDIADAILLGQALINKCEEIGVGN